jgi:drug/metabolite transporter (DMT)-like permease
MVTRIARAVGLLLATMGVNFWWSYLISDEPERADAWFGAGALLLALLSFVIAWRADPRQLSTAREGVRLVLSFVLVLASYAVSLGLAWFAGTFTLNPLGSGRYEGTPVTVVVFLGVFLLMVVVSLVAGSIALNRYFTARGL